MKRKIVNFTGLLAVVMTLGLLGSWSCHLPGACAASATSDEAQAYLAQGNDYSNNGQLDQALEAYTKALQINRHLADAYYNRGNVYSIKGQLDQAIADYTKALRINPQFDKAYFNRGWVYAKQDQAVQALADFNRVLQINPQCADAWFFRGAACETLYNKSGALEAYRQFLRYASEATNPRYIKLAKESIAALGG